MQSISAPFRCRMQQTHDRRVIKTESAVTRLPCIITIEIIIVLVIVIRTNNLSVLTNDKKVNYSPKDCESYEYTIRVVSKKTNKNYYNIARVDNIDFIAISRS